MGEYVPKVATLDGFTEITETVNAVALAETGFEWTLVVQTENSTYTILVLDPAKREVAVTGGKYFPSPEKCVLSGSLFGGSFLWVGRIGIGMRIELMLNDGITLITSPVKKISVYPPAQTNTPVN